MLLGGSSLNAPPPQAMSSPYHHHFTGPPNPGMPSGLYNAFTTGNTFLGHHHQTIATNDHHHEFHIRTPW